MAHKQSIRRFRNWYATLLRLYPKPYRERFAEPMEQTFNDLLQERAEQEKGLFGFVFWIFVETFVGIIRETLTIMPKIIIRPALLTALILLIPFFGNLYIDGWNWPWYGFIFAGTVLFGAGLTYELVARRTNNKAYRFAVGLAVVTAFLLFWTNRAAGMLGEENPANLMYFGVFAVGLIGAAIARLKPRGMANTMLAMAFAQMSVPVIALIFWGSNFVHQRHPPFPMLFAPSMAGIFAVNAFFAMFFVGSALLFRRASASVVDAT